ncbi:MAG: helicase-related protein [Candidatus Zapsychrus exili]|nr:helicase-related protein [Candidatus Zapsychrus exili]
MDVSVIDQMPSGRGKIETERFDEESAEEVYNIVKENVSLGHQAYIVYPIIEESEKLDLKAAEDMYWKFKKSNFKGLRVGLVHGQMKQNESQDIMQKFKDHQIDILVATSVLEVGIDVPNATVMVIEHADRFGLAQLHQLRGRVGRGAQDSLCLLISNSTTEDSHRRLKAIVSTIDGFKIAQEDLLIRGPGHFFGRHQHGLNELKVANPVTQIDILELARKEALELTKEDPKLEKEDNRIIKRIVRRRYPNYLAMAKAG